MAKQYSERDRSEILTKINNYISEGQNELDDWQEDRNNAEGVWDAEFKGANTPKNTFYYPTGFALLRHYVRALAKTYQSSSDIVEITPYGRIPEYWQSQLGDYMKQLINTQLDKFADFPIFIDDTGTQVIKYGICYAKTWWKRTYRKEERERSTGNFEFVDGAAVEQMEKYTEKVIDKNHLCIEYVPVEDILYDLTAKKWSDVRWVIHRNIELTEDELWSRVETHGYDHDQVQAFLYKSYEETQADDTKDLIETKIYKIAEFWGKLALPEDNEPNERKVVKAVKVVTDNDGDFMLMNPSEKVLKYNDGSWMNPISGGYMIREEGEVRGRSWCLIVRDLQGEINAIRNQRRKSVQNDLTERYLLNTDAEVEFIKFEEAEEGTIIGVGGAELDNSLRELRHWDNTQGSYSELDAVRADLDRLTGVNQYALGMADPHMADTLGGMQLMSNASNTVIYDNIVRYNMFLEDVLRKGLHLTMQYTTMDDLVNEGIKVPQGLTKEELNVNMNLRLDTGYGATSEMVKLNNMTKQYFLMQQFMQYCVNSGIEPGAARFLPLDILRDMLPLLNGKNIASRLPNAETFMENTMQMLQQRMQQQQQQKEEAAGVIQNAMENAEGAGEAALQEMVDQQTGGV